MTTYKLTWQTPDTFTSDLTAYCALLLSFIRFTVEEEYGGTIETDQGTGTTYIGIPDWAEDACIQKLVNLVGPAAKGLTRH